MSKRNQIHFDLNDEVFKQFNILLPGRGQRAEVLRRFVKKYIEASGVFKIGDANPVDTAAEEVVEKDKSRGLL